MSSKVQNFCLEYAPESVEKARGRFWQSDWTSFAPTQPDK